MSTSISALTPEAARAAKAFLHALQLAGVPFDVTSTRRTFREQAQLYRAAQSGESRLPAAAPGSSLHEKGLAIDIAMPAQYRATAAAIAADYGWQWAGNVDPVHYSYRGTSSHDKTRRAPGKRVVVRRTDCRIGPPVQARPLHAAVTRSTAIPTRGPQIHGYLDPTTGVFHQTASRWDAQTALAKQQGWEFVTGVRDGAYWALTSPYSPVTWLIPFKYSLAISAGQALYERWKG